MTDHVREATTKQHSLVSTAAFALAVSLAGGASAQDTQTRDSPPRRADSLDATTAQQRPDGDDETVTTTMPEVLVVGSKSINADIRRTEDAPQPYVVIGAEEIRQSQTSSIGELLSTRLPMNTTQGELSRNVSSSQGNQSSINLRGLGTSQTLILIDGRRIPNLNLFTHQPDINGVPLAAIERIEVLASTAGGIYGGGATGGVINIITRQDYTGVDLSTTYGASTRGDAQRYQLDGSAGFSLNDGRTRFIVAGSHQQSDPLKAGDRNFIARARSLQLANNPAAFDSLTTPPLGYTSNIRSVNGSLLTLDNGTALGSSRTSVPVGYGGVSTDNGAALVGNAGRYNLDLPDTYVGRQRDILLDSQVNSLSVNFRQDLGQDLDFFADLAWYENLSFAERATGLPTSVTLAANAPNNPFTTPIVVSFPATDLTSFVESNTEVVRGVAGLVYRLPRRWVAAVDFTWGRSSFFVANAATQVGDPDGTGPNLSSTVALQTGVLDVVRDLNVFPLNWDPYRITSPNQIIGPLEATLKSSTARVSGPLLRLPGGEVTLTGQFEWREDTRPDSFNEVYGSTNVRSVTLTPRRSQRVLSYAAEIRAPVISASNAGWWGQELELQASVRHDNYVTTSSNPNSLSGPSREGPFPDYTFNSNEVEATQFTLGARYVPFRGLALRASFGTGFLPPQVDEISPGTPSQLTSTLIDPRRGGVSGTVGPYQSISGGNSDLVPEESESWSAGAIITFPSLANFRLSLDYTRIEKDNEIRSEGLQFFLDNEATYPDRVTREPLTAADATRGFTGGVITGINTTRINLAKSRLEAFDVQADYRISIGRWGSLAFNTILTYQPEFARKLTATSSFINTAGFNGGVLKLRGNAGINWTYGAWSVNWNAQYYDSYRPYAADASATSVAATVLSQGSDRIPSQTYHDIGLTYGFDDGPFRDTQITVGVQNLLDTSPPTIATTGVDGGYSTYGDPRLQRFTVTLRKTL